MAFLKNGNETNEMNLGLVKERRMSLNFFFAIGKSDENKTFERAN